MSAYDVLTSAMDLDEQLASRFDLLYCRGNISLSPLDKCWLRSRV